MAAIVLELIALFAVVLSFVFAALVVLSVQRSRAERSVESADQTLARVVADVERLAALRDRGALTEKEFVAQKNKLLRG